MRIYISFHQNIGEANLQRIKSLIVANLTPYYGRFDLTSVWAYPQEGPIEVHVMDSAKYSGKERSIEEQIKKILMPYYPNEKVNVHLNYQLLFPNFNPSTANTPQTKKQTSSPEQPKNAARRSEEFDYEKLSENYQAEIPRYSFEQVILPKDVVDKILEAVGTIQVEHKVFDEWGLRSIIPNASSALSFYGPPGTGKSMAAEAIAQKLGKKILRATYADIESKFHGEGPKMVKAIFRAAERDDAILFLDESDSLLSKRLTNVSDGSAQAINSMRSQLLICLEQFKGIVIFATNLVVNYDKAFLSRLINIEFTMPDAAARTAIWEQHLKGKGLRIPLSEDIDIPKLAEQFEFCGREIKNSVKDACVTVAISNRDVVCQNDLVKAAEKTRLESEKVMNAKDHTKANLSPEQSDALKQAVQKKIDAEKAVSVDQLDDSSRNDGEHHT